MKSKIIFFSIVAIALSLNIGCGDKFAEKLRDKHIIPYVSVYTQIDLGIGGESNLQNPGQPLYMNTSRPDGKPLGYKGHGIILINLNGTEYKCWDATCTNCQDLNSFFSQKDLQGEIAICPVCKAEFSLQYGTAFNLSQKIYPLRDYPITKSGNKLYVNY